MQRLPIRGVYIHRAIIVRQFYSLPRCILFEIQRERNSKFRKLRVKREPDYRDIY